MLGDDLAYVRDFSRLVEKCLEVAEAYLIAIFFRRIKFGYQTLLNDIRHVLYFCLASCAANQVNANERHTGLCSRKLHLENRTLDTAWKVELKI